MLFGLIELIFNIIKAIWYAPVWLVILFVIILAIINIVQGLFGNPNSGGTENAMGSGSAYVPTTDQIEQPFSFYDYNGERCGRGDCFYDSEGNCVSWGDGFCDGKGYQRDWGDDYYDALGYFRSWGDCFYDTQGNLVYPEK